MPVEREGGCRRNVREGGKWGLERKTALHFIRRFCFVSFYRSDPNEKVHILRAVCSTVMDYTEMKPFSVKPQNMFNLSIAS